MSSLKSFAPSPNLIHLCPCRNYVDEKTALQKNLTFAHHDHFVIRADHTTVLDPRGPGRDSVRLESNNVYGNHVTVCVSHPYIA